MVNILTFDRPGHAMAQLRRGTIAPFAKYPPSLEQTWRHKSVSCPLYSCDRAASYSTMIVAATQGKLCHRYMVIMDDTGEVVGPISTALVETREESRLMFATGKIDYA